MKTSMLDLCAILEQGCNDNKGAVVSCPDSTTLLRGKVVW